MGKKITIAVLLILILGGAIWQHIYITGATEKLTEELSLVSESLKSEDYDKALKTAETFAENWEKEKHLYETLFEHEEIDMISERTQRMVELCYAKDQGEALAETAATLYYIRHIHQIDSIKWENIF